MSLGVGNHALTASFAGTGGFADSTSAAVTETVNRASTTVALAPSVKPAATGQAVTFTATVAVVAPGAGVPTGTVTFRDGNVVLGTAAVGRSGTATFTTSFAATGGHAITAVYSGDANFVGSSKALTEQVNAPTKTTLQTSTATAVFGQTETLTATVTSQARVPTGTVTFRDGNTVLGIVSVNANGQAKLTGSLGVGNHALTASFAGTGGFTGSTSAAVTETVRKAATTTALRTSASSVPTGQAVTFTVTVAAVAPGAGTPTGTITFKDGNTVLGTVVVGSGGIATFVTGFAATGGHSITAVYSGSGNFLGGASAAVAETVVPPAAHPVGLQRGGFETPNVGTGAFAYRPAGSAWTFSGNTGVSGNGSGFTAGNPNAPQGTQVAFLQTTGSFSQSVTLAAGTYSLTFAAAQRGNVQASSQTFQVLVDGMVVGTFTPAGTSYSTLTTNSFTVAAGAHAVRFVGLDPNGGDNTAFIDNVQLLAH